MYDSILLEFQNGAMCISMEYTYKYIFNMDL